MYYVGIDVAKDKHDCCIVGECGNIVVNTFRIKNSLEGYTKLIQRINNLTSDRSKVIIGLEDTGHYSGNLVNYFLNLFEVRTINPLLTAKQKKAETLRKTKTDKIDAVQIAKMLRNGTGFRPVISIPYNSEELKSLSRYRTVLVKNRSKERTSVKRLINILFPEYEHFFCHIHCLTSYTVLSKYPGKDSLAICKIPALTKILRSVSKGYYGEDMAVRLREAAKNSIGTVSDAKSYELKQTIRRIHSLDSEIADLDSKIHALLTKSNPPITTIPGIGEAMAASIIGEIGDFSKFSNPGKILAMAGMSPTTYQSGKYISGRARMEKRGSSNLRRTLFLATRIVCQNIPEFGVYLEKKRMEGKHYFVALSHTTKKLVRLMYALETEHRSYIQNPAH
ncbi:IS110 family transposase [Candidatus Saccharibacteria bacterium]|nr:IS110 family transposase [Candidatus Saccharibacteria bacterium]